MELVKQKPFGLEDRTFEFAQKIRNLMKAIPSKNFNPSDKEQIIRSSGSVGANPTSAVAPL